MTQINLCAQPNEVLWSVPQAPASWVLPKLECGCRWPCWVITGTGESWNAEMLKPRPQHVPATLQEFPWGELTLAHARFDFNPEQVKE